MSPGLVSALLAAGGLVFAIVVLTLGVDLVHRLIRRRRARIEGEHVLEALAASRSMPAPAELERAPDVTKATRRRMTRRVHPVIRKRGSRRYGA